MPKLKLQPRERVVVIGGAIALVAIVLYWGFQGPYEAYKNSAMQVKATRTRLQQAQLWQAEVETARAKEEQLLKLMQSHAPDFNLFTHVDRAVLQSKLTGRAEILDSRTGAAPRSRLSAVDLTLKGVSTSELVLLLHRIYDEQAFVVLEQVDQLRPAANGQGLDCRMTFVAPKI